MRYETMIVIQKDNDSGERLKYKRYRILETFCQECKKTIAKTIQKENMINSISDIHLETKEIIEKSGLYIDKLTIKNKSFLRLDFCSTDCFDKFVFNKNILEDKTPSELK